MRSRRKKDEEHENHERWLVSYADFITLLFAFFVVLYATSNTNEKKQQDFQKSIKKYFLGARAGQAAGISGDGKMDHKANDAAIINPIRRFKKNPAAIAVINDQVNDFIEDQLSKEEVKKYVKDIDSDRRGVRLIIDANRIYSKDSEFVSSSAVSFVEKIATLINKLEAQVLIENHYSGKNVDPYASTWEFSAVRSTILARYLSQKLNVDILQVVPIGFGDSRPFTSPKNSTQNNRVELVFTDDHY